jgi:hypothetical protein
MNLQRIELSADTRRPSLELVPMPGVAGEFKQVVAVAGQAMAPTAAPERPSERDRPTGPDRGIEEGRITGRRPERIQEQTDACRAVAPVCPGCRRGVRALPPGQALSVRYRHTNSQQGSADLDRQIHGNGVLDKQAGSEKEVSDPRASMREAVEIPVSSTPYRQPRRIGRVLHHTVHDPRDLAPTTLITV